MRNEGDTVVSQSTPPSSETEFADLEAVPVSAADVESAGRSCLVILTLGVIIFVIVCIWIVWRSTAG